MQRPRVRSPNSPLGTGRDVQSPRMKHFRQNRQPQPPEPQ
jgi:hypothetical protein